MAREISKRLFTVHEYHRMVDAGILREGDRVELIHGEVITMSPISPRHNAAILRANHSLMSALLAVVRSHAEPQPDLYLLRPKDDFYASRHAGPADIFLIIEVADSTLEYDQDVKMHLYADTLVPEYWIANLRDDLVIAYSDIEGDTYRTVRQFRRGETLTLELLPECRIPVDVLLP